MIELIDVSRTEARAICAVEFDADRRMAHHLTDSERFLLIYVNDTFLGIIGAARPTILSGRAYIWFAETPAVQRYAVTFLRGMSRARDLLLSVYSDLVGISYDQRSIAWLSWLGAEFGEVLPNGAYPFIVRRVHG